MFILRGLEKKNPPIEEPGISIRVACHVSGKVELKPDGETASWQTDETEETPAESMTPPLLDQRPHSPVTRRGGRKGKRQSLK